MLCFKSLVGARFHVCMLEDLGVVEGAVYSMWSLADYANQGASHVIWGLWRRQPDVQLTPWTKSLENTNVLEQVPL